MLLILSEKIFLSIWFVMCCCIEWQKIIQSTKLCPSYYVHFNPLPYIYIRTQTLVLVNSMWNSQCSFDSKEWKKRSVFFSIPILWSSFQVWQALYVLNHQLKPIFFSSPPVTSNFDFKYEGRSMTWVARNNSYSHEQDYSSLIVMLAVSRVISLTSRIGTFKISVNADEIRIDLEIHWTLRWTDK